MKASDSHNQGWLEKSFAAGLLIIFGLVVFHAPLTVWLGTFTEYDILVKSWKEFLLVALVPLATVILFRRPDVRERLIKDPLIWLITGYAILHKIYFFNKLQDTVPYLAGLAIDLRYLLFFVLVYIAALTVPKFQRRTLQVVFFAAAVSLLFAVLQVVVLPPDILSHIGYGKDTIEPYLTIDKNPDYVRINGTLRGPNPLGAYVLVIAALAVSYLLFHRGKLHTSAAMAAVLVMAPAVLWATHSRSAWLGVIVSIGVLAFLGLSRKINKYWVAALIAGPLLVLGSAIYVLKDTDFVSHVIVHSDPSDPVLDNSNEGHLESLIDGGARVLLEPFGRGPGSTGSASLLGDKPIVIENQYLFIAHEAGWLGLVLFLAIFVIVIRRLWQVKNNWFALGVMASGIGLAVVGLVLPVWVDDTVSLVWWGLAGLAIAQNHPHGKRKLKD